MYKQNTSPQEHMINSLSKDSHITQFFGFQKTPYHSDKSKQRSIASTEAREYCTTAVNKQGIIANKPAEISFSGFSNTLCTHKQAKRFFEFADRNQIVFSAGFSLLLTCLLRPAAIMALPGDKKNKDDKLYASAHSIASGVIGFVVANIISTPISDAVKKITSHPETYLKKNIELIKKDSDKIGSNYLNKLPDILMAVPKGIITISLIPPILKYVFGWEKKPAKKSEPVQIPQEYASLNFKSTDSINKKSINNFGIGGKQCT